MIPLLKNERFDIILISVNFDFKSINKCIILIILSLVQLLVCLHQVQYKIRIQNWILTSIYLYYIFTSNLNPSTSVHEQLTLDNAYK